MTQGLKSLRENLGWVGPGPDQGGCPISRWFFARYGIPSCSSLDSRFIRRT